MALFKCPNCGKEIECSKFRTVSRGSKLITIDL